MCCWRLLFKCDTRATIQIVPESDLPSDLFASVTVTLLEFPLLLLLVTNKSPATGGCGLGGDSPNFNLFIPGSMRSHEPTRLCAMGIGEG